MPKNCQIINSWNGVSGLAWQVYLQRIIVNTHPAYHRQRLSTIASAALLIECLETGRVPLWDAENPESA